MEPATAFDRIAAAPLLPDVFARWFAGRGWTPRPHQLELLAKAREGRSVLLIAPTGGGKTLAGFLPTLVELHEAAAPPRRLISTGRDLRRAHGLHTLYISPLKALAVDIARNLEIPVQEMDLAVRLETRTGDTPASKRARQRRYPPDILLTTPEQLALLLASADAPYLFGTLRRVVLDELHSLVTSKRGDLLSLGLARLFALAPQIATVGLSATVGEPDDLARYLVPQPDGGGGARRSGGGGGRRAAASRHARHGRALALGRPFGAPRARRNLRSDRPPQDHARVRQHPQPGRISCSRSCGGSTTTGSPSRSITARSTWRSGARSRTPWWPESCSRWCATSSLDLGVDWGDVDLVINVGAPKGASRLLQRIGRSNHRLDEPSQAVLVPANRFEVLECRAAIDAVAENAQDTPPLRTGALDVLAQHILGRAVGVPFLADELYAEVRVAAPYAALARSDFDAAVDFVATGGYALKAYERFAKIRKAQDGRWRITHPRVAQRYRMNVGTIVEADMLEVRLVRSRASGASFRAEAGCSARSRNV